jgi:hypothetical protein
MEPNKSNKTKHDLYGGYQPLEKGYQAQDTGTIDKSKPPTQGSGVPSKKGNSK